MERNDCNERKPGLDESLVLKGEVDGDFTKFAVVSDNIDLLPFNSFMNAEYRY
jgi:hypothetical protein